MADLVGLQAQTPDVLGRLSQLLTLQSQRQALAGQAAEVKSAQQSQRQRAALASYDWNKHIGEDGTIDLNTLTDPELMHAAGDQYQEVLSKAIQAKSQQLEAKSKLFALRGDQRAAFSSLMTPLLSDEDVVKDTDKGRQKVNEAWVQFGQLYGDDALPVLQAYAKPLRGVPKGRMADALRAIQLQGLDVDKQVAAQQPNLVNTGSALKNVNPLAAVNTRGDVPLTVSPGQQDTILTDQLGNQYRAIRDKRGNITGTERVPGERTDSGPARFETGERHSLEQQAQQNFENVTANRSAASMAPQQLDQIDKAIDLSKQVTTSQWAQKRANIESNLGALIPGFDSAESDATKLQLLDKFAERIATDASRVLGVNATTDAQRESIHKQNANIGYTPQAVQDVLKYAKAQTMAMQAKGDAQEAWLQGGNKITKQHEFETKFRQAYDPRIFQYAVMTPEERKKFTQSLSADERAQIAKKTRALRELGALPNE